MKLLFVNYEFPPIGGGGGTTTRFLASFMAKRGHEVKVVCGGYKDLPTSEWIDGFEVVRIDTGRKRKDRCSQLEMVKFIIKSYGPLKGLVKDWQPALLHVFFGYPTGPLGWLINKNLGVPYIISLLGGDVPGIVPKEVGLHHKVLAPFTREMWGKACAVVGNSYGLSKIAQNFLPKIEVTTIPNGVDIEKFKPNPNNSDNLIKLLFIGRLVNQKGLNVLLKAYHNVIEGGYKNTRLIIIGDGPLMDEYKQFSQDNKLSDFVEFKGWVDFEELEHLYNSSDVFVLPSLFEGMPSVVLQAMACGLPIISSRVQGSEDLIKPGVNGYLVEIGSVDDITDKMIRVITDGGMRKQMGIKSREIIKGYSWDNVSSRYEELYRQAIDSK